MSNTLPRLPKLTDISPTLIAAGNTGHAHTHTHTHIYIYRYRSKDEGAGEPESEHVPSATLVQKVLGRLSIMEAQCFVCEYSSTPPVHDDDDDAGNVVPCQFSFVACLQEDVPVYHMHAKKPLRLLNDEVSKQ